MIERAADDPLLVFGWVTGDEAYGDNTALRRRCAGRGVNYVFAVSCDHRFVLGGQATRADAAFADLDQTAWQRRSCGDGAKGRRWYDWAWIGLGEHEGRHQWMLARRSISDPADLAFYRCQANRPVGLPELVRVAGSRWSVEECFQAAKNEVGLDHYQVRKHTAWYRHITLAMVAHAHLAFLAAGQPQTQVAPATAVARPTTSPHRGPIEEGRSRPDGVDRDEPDQLAPLTVNEIRRLHAQLHQPRHRIHWSRWRRRYQARARRCHHQRQRRLIDH